MGNRIYLTDFFFVCSLVPSLSCGETGYEASVCEVQPQGYIGKGSQHVMYQYRSINFNINITFV